MATGQEGLDDVPPEVRWPRTNRMGDLSMVLWPALTLIGFVLITAFVVAMGMQSTARYEREQNAAPATGRRQTAAEPVGAIPA